MMEAMVILIETTMTDRQCSTNFFHHRWDQPKMRVSHMQLQSWVTMFILGFWFMCCDNSPMCWMSSFLQIWKWTKHIYIAMMCYEAFGRFGPTFAVPELNFWVHWSTKAWNRPVNIIKHMLNLFSKTAQIRSAKCSHGWSHIQKKVKKSRRPACHHAWLVFTTRQTPVKKNHSLLYCLFSFIWYAPTMVVSIVAVVVTVTAVDLAVFKASVLLGHLINKNQTIKFSWSGAPHQNDIAEIPCDGRNNLTVFFTNFHINKFIVYFCCYFCHQFC